MKKNPALPWIVSLLAVAIFLLCLTLANKEEWCPRCDGEGKVQFTRTAGSIEFGRKKGELVTGMKTCPVCDGAGKVKK